MYKDPNIDGWMHKEDLRWLYDRAQKMESIAEIGCWKGKSTHALLSGIEYNEVDKVKRVYAIDPFDGGDLRDTVLKEAKTKDIHAIFLQNVGHFPDLRVFEMTCEEASKEFGSLIVDMVFIDGSHNYDPVCFDINFWLPKTKKLICGHDIKHPPVKQAAEELLGDIKVTNQNIWYKEL